jgi:hypothetical protein
MVVRIRHTQVAELPALSEGQDLLATIFSILGQNSVFLQMVSKWFSLLEILAISPPSNSSPYS